MKRGKKYVEAAKNIDRQTLYEAADAISLVKKNATAKFDETIEAHIRTGCDGRHAEQQIRGAVVLPHGTGKTLRSWNKNTPSKDKCPHALRRLLSCFLRTTTQCHPSTALAISSPCATTKCLPACMPTLPADMAGDSGTTSPTSVNGRKNWRSGCVKGSYSRSLNLPQRNKSNYE